MSESRAPFLIRPATVADGPRLGELAAQLVRLHHGYDPQRFFTWEPLEPGYARFLTGSLRDPDAVILVAERQGEVIGYAYGRVEPRDWNALLDRCGVLHDLLVDRGHRRAGVASALLVQTAAALQARGVPRVVLSTAWKNAEAQAFFEKHGFRRTMIEMTRERT